MKKNKNPLDKYNYEKKSNRLAKIGIAASLLLPGTFIGEVILAAAAGNAFADAYWHPERYGEWVEKHYPMPAECLTDEELKALDNSNNDEGEERNE